MKCENNLRLINYKPIKYLIDFIDIDEYLVMQTFDNVKEMIKKYLPFDIIKLNWVLFGNGKHKNDPLNNSLIENFKYSRNVPFHAIKSLGKTSKISSQNGNNPHIFPMFNSNNLIIKNCNNTISKNDIYHSELETLSTNIKDIPIYIAHYFIQSTETFLKRRYFRIDRPIKDANRELIINNFEVIKDIFHNYDVNHPLVKDNKDILNCMNFMYAHNLYCDNLNSYLYDKYLDPLKKLFEEKHINFY